MKGVFGPAGHVPLGWRHVDFIPVPRQLTLQENTIMTEERRILDIKVNFADRATILVIIPGLCVQLVQRLLFKKFLLEI